MDGRVESSNGRGFREQVQFYLLDHRTRPGKAVDVALLAFNLAFVAIVVVETYPIASTLEGWLWGLEVGLALLFLVEYLLRIYGAENRLAEFLNGYTMVDLVSILPTLAVFVVPGLEPVALQFGFLRVLRIVRVLRLYRFTRDAEFFFGTVQETTLRSGKLVLTVLVLLFVSAGLFYAVEHPVNPAVGTFGDAFYYAVVALTTVGFGDIVPTTTAGRWVTVATILLAVILIPRQAGRIVREWTTSEKVDVTCPNCGLSAHDPDASHCKACGHVIYHEYDPDEG